MNNPEYITKEICDLLKEEKTKIAKKVLNWMDYDYISIVKYRNCFWYERDMQYMPKYVCEYLNKFIKKNLGVEYLYDKTIKMEGKNEYIY